MKKTTKKKKKTMEVTDGNLSWAATLDISGISKAKDTLVKYFKDMGLSAEEAGKRADEAMENIEGILKEATKEVKTQAEAVEVLKDAYEEIQEQLEEMEDGTAKEVLQGVGDGIREIVEEMEAMSQEDVPLDELGQEAVSARQQLREMTEELVNMKMRGEENTEAYQRLLEKVGVLKDAMADTQQAVKGMASDTAALDSVLGAAQLTAGGFSAIIGAMNLVGAGEDTKELAEAQKKLQAAIAITTGLQSVQNALQKQSAVMLGIQKIQTLAAAKAEAIKTAATAKGVVATKAATIAQAAFNAVANANPYVLLATAILTVVGALFAFTSGTKECEHQNESLNNELERQIGILNQLIGLYDSLQSVEINRLRNTLDLLKAQGASTESIAEAERKLDEAEQERIDRRKVLYKELLDNEKALKQQLEDLLNTDPEWIENFAKQNPEGYQRREEAIEDLRKRLEIINQIHIDEENLENRKAIRQARREAEEKERRDKAAREASERRQKNLEEERRYQEELRQARERAEDLELGNGSDNINTRVAKVELEYDRQIAEAERKADEARANNKLELAEQYERQVSALMKKRDAEINQLYADEEEAQEQALADMLDNYKGYDARRKAIEQKYTQDIEKLTQKRDEFEEGSEEWLDYNQAIAEALQQQNDELQELEIEYGELNQLIGKRESLERQILIVANKIKKAETDEEKEALVKEMAGLKEQLRQVNAEIDKMNESLAETEDKMGEIASTDIVDLAKDLTEAFAEMSGASKKTADDIGIMADGISSVASGYLQGGIAGAIIGAISWAIDGMRNLAEQTAKENEELANFKAELDKIHQSFHLGDSFDTIFGEDVVGKAETAAGAIDYFTNKVSQWLRFYTNNAVSSMWDFSSYRIQGLNNYNLEELASEWGMNLWDSNGHGYNADFIQKVLDQYGDQLSEAEKRMLQGLLNYSEALQDASAEIASYLTSLFGGVADTIADQFLNSFLEGEQAAMDFGAVVSDVAKQMAKDFIKNMLMENVFNGLAEDFKYLMEDDSLTPEEKQQWLLAWLSAAQAQVEELQPEIQAYLEAMSQFFGASDEAANAAMSGNLLQSASQDSVDLLNGQLNAIRTNQSFLTGRIDDILLTLAGIRNDMNDGFSRSIQHLENIDDNTSEGGSILRQLGIWIG